MNRTNFLAIILMFIGLKLMDFNQTMTAYWVGPYLSAAINFNWHELVLYVNWEEIKMFAELSNNEFFEYNFTNTTDTVVYNYLAKGLVLLLILSKQLFFWQGDLESLQSLQYIVHIMISLIVLNLFKLRYQKILFFLLYAINPVILSFVNYPFYYFWQVVPSALFIYWYLNDNKKRNFIYGFSLLFALMYLTRPTVLLLIILFYILYSFRDSYKKGIIGFGIFFILINIAPKLEIGPWHTAYVGIGAYENIYNIKLSDNDAYLYYKNKRGIEVNSSNIMLLKDDYYAVLKKKIFEIMNESPMMLLKNALFNIAQSYSLGYSYSLNQKVGNYNLVYLSIFIGLIMMFLLLYTQQYIIFLAVGFAAGGFSLYYPPISAYMYGSYLLIVIGFIGIVNYFLEQKRESNVK